MYIRVVFALYTPLLDNKACKILYNSAMAEGAKADAMTVSERGSSPESRGGVSQNGTALPQAKQNSVVSKVGKPLQPRPKVNNAQGEAPRDMRFELSKEELREFDTAINRQIQKLEQQLRTLANNRPVAPYKKPFAGIAFYGTLIIVATKDVFDLGVQLLELFGDATVIIGVVIQIFAMLLAFMVFISSNTLYLMEGVKPNKIQKNTRIWTFIGEMLPIISFLPLGTIALIVMAYTERKKALAKRAEDQATLDANWMKAQQLLRDQINELASM